MQQIQSYEAGEGLGELLALLKQNGTLTITQEGVPVAEVSLLESERQKRVRQSFENIRKIKQSPAFRPSTREEVLEMIREGRR